MKFTKLVNFIDIGLAGTYGVLHACLAIRAEHREDVFHIVLHVLLRLCVVRVEEVARLTNGSGGRCGRGRDRGGDLAVRLNVDGVTLDKLHGEVRRYDELDGDVGDLSSIIGCARERCNVYDELL